MKNSSSLSVSFSDDSEPSNITVVSSASINIGFHKGELSITQRQGIITCIPKEDKAKTLLKNWRPLTLLNVVYKIASGAIANRLKLVLDELIDKDQTGIIKGRFIGENTRLIYDIMSFTEQNDIPGL